MSLFNFFRLPSAQATARHADIINAIQHKTLPKTIATRLHQSRTGNLPWIATISPAQLAIIRAQGIYPIATVSASCWLHYGWSWSKGHAQGWHTALRRLIDEAKAAGANAVIDVKMRTIPLKFTSSMDFSLIGTAVRIDGLPPSSEPVIAMVPALEFIKLLEADIVPTGIAVGAHYEWISDWRGDANLFLMGNIECSVLSDLWQRVKVRAHEELRRNAHQQGNGVLAHTHFSQLFEYEQEKQPTQYLARYIVIATTVTTSRSKVVPYEMQMVMDMNSGDMMSIGTGCRAHSGEEVYANEAFTKSSRLDGLFGIT